MNILHVIPTLRKGGAERLVLDICIELSKTHNVCLVSFSPENDYSFLSKKIHHEIIESSVIPSITGKHTVVVDRFYEFVASFNPNVIHSHLFEAELVSRWKIIPGVKYNTHCHDNMLPFSNFSFKDIFSKKRLTELYEKKLILGKYKKCNNQFIAISNDTFRYFNASLPPSLSKNIVLLNNAIDYNRFKSNPRISVHSPIRIINAGSFVAKKNQKLFIPILKQLIERGVDCRIILLGDGPLRIEILHQIESENLESFFELPGNVDNVEDWFRNADIYVHTATYEPFGLVLLEAMASGLPVISLDGKGNKDVLEHLKNSILISDNIPDSFVEAITILIKNTDIYFSLSTYAKSFSKNFDIEKYVACLLTHYA